MAAENKIVAKEDMKTVKIGLLGLGTVGGGTLAIIQQTQAEIERRLGQNIEVVIVAVRHLELSREVNTSNLTLTDQPEEVVNHPDVEIVVELMGGTTLAKTLLETAIAQGKHIVTANKALIAEQGNELLRQAKQHHVMVNYEAAVAGGIPIIKALREALAGNQIEWVAGIINGTANYILTEMKEPDADFDEVLKTAQKLGYAEADPTFDVEGIDAAHKLTILASIAFGIPLQFDKVYTEGISKVSPDDIRYADQLGYQVKHLGVASRTEQGYCLRVYPALVPNDVLLASVNGVMNAIMVKGNHVGPTMYYGPGAGGSATASAVVADIIDTIRWMQQPHQDQVPALGFALEQMNALPVENVDQIETSYYIRCFAKDVSGVLAKISSVLAEHDISIELLHQEPNAQDPENATVVMTTNVVKEAKVNDALRELAGLDEIDDEIMRMRIETLE